MIGHGTVFIAALATSAAAYLGLPTSTAPERCATRNALSQPAVLISAGLPHGVSIHGTSSTHATRPIRRRSC
jgi:hypothetical protein